ncbi:MAG: Holliday junction branch migration protein RuvA [Flavobacteriaceae bacterium]|nr:Holliday junction branch migration protein RuvA [Flavobacteriaceae bacterium]
MITYLKGLVVEKTPTYIVIDCNGIGYMANVSIYTSSKIEANTEILLYAHLSVKEDSHTIYGFYDKLEREIFRLLISVSGIGPSASRALLSTYTPTEIQHIIAMGDAKSIQAAKGIGAKTAQRLIIDLKDKVLKTLDIDKIEQPKHNNIKNEALSALEVLGFNNKLSEKIIDKVFKNTPEIDLENLIKQALKLF